MSRFLPILTFHALEDDRSPIAFPPGLFLQALERVAEHGYRTLALRDAADLFRRCAPLPNRTLVLTFDDGFRSVYDVAFPALRQQGMKATVFLTTGRGETRAGGRLPAHAGREMISWDEVRQMQAAGIEFGAHTRTHPDLTSLPPARWAEEILGAREAIEGATGAAVHSFAYPFGRWNRRVREEVRLHYACACTDTLALPGRRSDPFTLPRLDAYYLRSQQRLGMLFSSLLPFYLLARNVPRTIHRRLGPSPNREAD